MPIRGEGLLDSEHGEEGESHKTVYVLHPNCAIEDVEVE